MFAISGIGLLPARLGAWPELLLIVVLKATMLLALAALLDLALRRRASAALRHLVWSAALAGSLALVPLTLLAPGWSVKGLPLPTLAPHGRTAVLSQSALEGRTLVPLLTASPAKRAAASPAGRESWISTPQPPATRGPGPAATHRAG